ncbi:MAG: two-component system, NtrC family, sensor histidine kinase KinB [Gaiellales bacterium]|nr:two-component system, NtrC family, sensor histidine kinase KinB [Gaiellales bacterium]
MAALVITLAVALVAALLALAARERERRRALSQLGGSGDLVAAARAVMLGRTERWTLDAALALRDALLDASPTPVMLFDRGARLVRANRSAREAIPDLEVGSTAAVQAIATAVHDALAGRPPRPFDVTVYDPERRRFHAHLRTYADRESRSCVVVLADESAEADYRDARRLFSAGVSHELRTPLARMLALVDTLALPLAEQEREDTMDQMRDEIDAMRELIEDMMLLARLEVEGIADGEQCDVEEAVIVCLERHRDVAADAGLVLSGEATKGIVAAVPRRLVDVVLDNLVENAIRHAGEGATVDVRARGLGGAVELTVSDTGAGIPAEHLARVFERFHRVEGSRTGPGTGLGLAIVKHIAEAHGGRAVMESSEGEGTTVRVTLPAPAVRRGLAAGV